MAMRDLHEFPLKCRNLRPGQILKSGLVFTGDCECGESLGRRQVGRRRKLPGSFRMGETLRVVEGAGLSPVQLIPTTPWCMHGESFPVSLGRAPVLQRGVFSV